MSLTDIAETFHVEESALELILDAAFLFLEAGGAVTLTEWTGLSAVEKAALVAARRALQVDAALQIAAATGDSEARLRLVARVDGGAALRQAAVEKAAADMARALDGKRVPA